MSAVVLVPYDQLSRSHGAMRHARPDTHEILMVESESMLRSRPWHAQRLHLLLSSAAHFRAELAAEGFTVHHVRAETTVDAVNRFRSTHRPESLVSAEPGSHAQHAAWQRLGVEFVPNDLFLTPRTAFAAWAADQSILRMDAFYRWQRRRLDILMEDDRPSGGRWSFDVDNRLPPPKGAHTWPTVLEHGPDAIDEATWTDIERRGLPMVGAAPHGAWATTRAGALRQLSHFVEHSLAGFGPYEDAMPADTWSANHSLLSPYLNLGLLHPREVVEAVLARHGDGGVPMESCEGFIRQVIGWREYVNGLYWHFGDEYRAENVLGAMRDLPAALTEPGATSMACVGSIVEDIDRRGWVHHIPRLMVLANLALIAGISPSAFLAWMRRVFVDAADWVMVPNVIGMGVHADGGRMMTKPYAAGGAYISRMGRYCGSCPYDPRRRTGEDACPFTTLYWDFLDRNRADLEGNPRMAQQVRGLDRLSDLPEVRLRAAEVLSRLDAGTL